MFDRSTPRASFESIGHPAGVALSPVHGNDGPVIIQALRNDEPLTEWLAEHRQWVELLFAHQGALLFRNFGCADAAGFHAALEAIDCPPMAFSEETAPRTHLGRRIFTSTEHPATEEIFPHNEGSYFRRCPPRVFFFCQRAATAGGETTVVSGRRILSRMDSGLKQHFSDKGWSYIRRYGTGLGLGWQAAFGTDDPATVEAYCAGNDIQCEWRGDLLITQQKRQAIFAHPVDGEPTWCNHVCFFHRTALPLELFQLLEAEGPDAFPFETRFGDGDEIAATVVEELRDLYREAAVAVAWRNQDFLMLNNLRFAHGRRPYQGDRRLLFAMSDSEKPHDRRAEDARPA